MFIRYRVLSLRVFGKKVYKVEIGNGNTDGLAAMRKASVPYGIPLITR